MSEILGKINEVSAFLNEQLGKFFDFLNSISLSTIILLITVLSAIWFIKRLIDKQKRFTSTVFLLMILSIVAFVYLRSNEIGRMTMPELKDLIFPAANPANYIYRTEKRSRGGVYYTRYIFDKPRPKLKLSMNLSGEYFEMKDIRPLNRILRHLDLPTVSEGKPELTSITGRRTDVYIFRWDEYKGGALVVERSICEGEVELQSPHCLHSITVY